MLFINIRPEKSSLRYIGSYNMTHTHTHTKCYLYIDFEFNLHGSKKTLYKLYVRENLYIYIYIHIIAYQGVVDFMPIPGNVLFQASSSKYGDVFSAPSSNLIGTGPPISSCKITVRY